MSNRPGGGWNRPPRTRVGIVQMGTAKAGRNQGELPPGERWLAAYASHPGSSRGRAIAEAACATRSPYQRDRDRIVHASAFRRLSHKTQVFIYDEGDHYRSRLTHSIEVAQIARSMARLLGLDEDLAEAIALAHDLGHSPFGHAGERALDRAMAGHGGFNHNVQSLRVVTRLERRYAAFDGLNLTWETLEGLAKHNGPLADGGDAPDWGESAPAPADLFAPGLQATGEAQAAAIADDIAYSNHDLDDALRAGVIELEMLEDVALTRRLLADVRAETGDIEDTRLIYEVNRRLITEMILDAVTEAHAVLDGGMITTVDGLRRAGRVALAFSPAMASELAQLQAFLFKNVYRHDRVMRLMQAAERIVEDLFRRYSEDGEALPAGWRARAKSSARGSAGDGGRRLRRIADFVAGMTDRYAIREHRRLFDHTPELR